VPAATRIDGLDEAVAYLKLFDNETLKAMNKEMYSVMKDLVPGTSPMSGWEKKSLTGAKWGTQLNFTPSKIRTGVRSKIGLVRNKSLNTRERAYLLINANPAGAIYETAGRKTDGATPQGRQFIKNIEERSGMRVIGKQGRLAWRAAINNRAEITVKMGRVVAKYQDMINRRLARY
jgi:hypothetical protein